MKIRTIYASYTGIYSTRKILLFIHTKGELLAYELTAPAVYGNLHFKREYKI